MEKTIYSVMSETIKSLDYDLDSGYTKAALSELRNSINRDDNYSGVVWQLLFDRLPKDFLNGHQNGKLTKEEKTVLSVLQLYAVHQQGKKETVNLEEKEHITDAGHFSVQFDGRYFYLDSKSSSDDKFISENTLSFDNRNKLVEYIEEWTEKLNRNPFYKRKYTLNFGGSLNKYRGNLSDKTAIDRRFNTMMTSNTYEELLNNLRHLIKIVKSKSLIKINYPKLAKDLYQFMGSYKDKEKVQLMWSQSYYFNNNKEENSDEK